MTRQGCIHGLVWEGIARPRKSERVFPIETLLSIPPLIPQVKIPDMEVLGWLGYAWSAVVRPVGRTVNV